MTVERALIVGAGKGISASVARRLAARGTKLMLASRHTENVADLAAETNALSVACNVADPASVLAMYAAVDEQLGDLDFVLFNPGYRTRGPFTELDAAEVQKTLMVSCYGGFLVAQPAAQRMVARGHGAIFFTGASASVKGYPQSAPFAMAKFGLRGMAQSMARELGPKGIHIAHFNIDGGVRSEVRPDPADNPDSFLDPDDIADTYMAVLDQKRSAWSLEVEVRPWVERF